MKQDHRFEEIDKAALRNALLAERVCPRCRRSLRHQAYLDNGMTDPDATAWGCVTCDLVYNIESDTPAHGAGEE